MASVGSLRVELELNDGSFTTRVIRAGTTLRDLERQVGQTVSAVRRLDSTIGNFGEALKGTVVTLGLARAALENLYTVFGAWAVSIAQVAGEMQRMNTLLRGMSQGVTELERATEAGNAVRYLNDLSRTAPFALREITAAFVRLRAGGVPEAERSVRALVDAVAAFGGSPQQLERASIAMQQMAGKGVISMEELRQQLGEAVPSALPLMARALETSVDDLVKKISDGRVRAAPALQGLTQEFERTFGGAAQAMMQTFNGQVQQTQNNWMRLQMRVGGVDEGGNMIEGGFLAGITAALQKLNQELSGPEAAGAAIRLGNALTGLTTSLIDMVNWIYRNSEAIGQLVFGLSALVGASMVSRLLSSLAVSLTATSLGLGRTAVAALAAANAFHMVFSAVLNSAGLARGLQVISAGFGMVTTAATTAAAAIGTTFARAVTVGGLAALNALASLGNTSPLVTIGGAISVMLGRISAGFVVLQAASASAVTAMLAGLARVGAALGGLNIASMALNASLAFATLQQTVTRAFIAINAGATAALLTLRGAGLAGVALNAALAFGALRQAAVGAFAAINAGAVATIATLRSAGIAGLLLNASLAFGALQASALQALAALRGSNVLLGASLAFSALGAAAGRAFTAITAGAGAAVAALRGVGFTGLLLNASLAFAALQAAATRAFAAIIAGALAATRGIALTGAILNATLALVTLRGTALAAAAAIAGLFAPLNAAAGAALIGTLRALAPAIGAVSLIAGGVAAAFAVITLGVLALSAAYRKLFGDAGEAYNRLRQGANDLSTITTAQREADTLATSLAGAIAQMRQLDALRSGDRSSLPNGARFVNQSDVNAGIDGLGTLGAQAIRVNDDAALLARRQQLNERIQELQQAHGERMQIIEGANENRLAQLADVRATALVSRVEASTRAARAAYAQQGREIENERRRIEAEFNNGQIDIEERNRRLDAQRATNLSSQLELYDGQLRIYGAALAEAVERQAVALRSSNREALLEAEKQVDKLEDTIKRIREARGQVIDEAGQPAGRGAFMESGNFETRQRQAETMLRNLTARVAELRAQNLGLGGELERVGSLIDQGLLRGVSPSKLADIRAMAAAVDELEAKLKRFREGQQGIQRIETGLDQAQRELQGYADRLEDPTLPEAQRRFIEFQRQMEAALRKVGLAAGEQSETFRQAALKTAEAIGLARQASAANTLEGYFNANRTVEITALPRGERLQLRLQEIRTERDAMLAAAAAIGDARDQAARIARVQRIAAAKEAAAERENREALASGARPTENMLTRLRARLAELREEVVDGRPQLEKYRELLARPGAPTGTAAEEVLRLASAIDTETKILERATRARNAYQEAERGVAESAARAREYFAQLEDPARAEGNRQLVVFRARMTEMVRLAREARAALPAGDGRAGAADRAIRDAETRSAEAIAQRAGELALQNAVRMRDADRQVRESLAETNAERRRLGLDNIAIEAEQARALIAASNMSTAERAAAERAVTAYITGQREVLTRQTESAVERQMRAWSNLSENTSQIFASNMDRMLDSLGDMVMGSKLKLGELTRAFVGELVKMELKAAASSVWGMIRKSLPGLDLFGGAGKSGASYGSGPNASGGSGGGFLFHRGGMVGSEGAPLSALSAALWRGAPRFHSGTMLKNDEVRAVLQRGEAVFTAGQLAEIGRMNHSYSLVESAIAGMVSAFSAPMGTPAAVGSTGRQGGQVTVNLINESGQQLDAKASQPRFNGEEMILDVVISNLQRPGRLRDAFKGMA